MDDSQSPQRVQIFENPKQTHTVPKHLMNSRCVVALSPDRADPTSLKRTQNYIEEELAQVAAQRGRKPFDATELHCDPEITNQLCRHYLPCFQLPRLLRCGNRMFGVTYKFTVFKASFSLHYTWLWSSRKLFTLKLDQRDLNVVRWDQNVRSNLIDVDTPRIIHAERQGKYCMTVMEPMAATMKCYMQQILRKTKNSDLYFGILMRTGIQCIRYLQRIHQNGYLHGNINPHTFVFPYRQSGAEGCPDIRRGPIIIDYSHAVNWKIDPIYYEENPGKHRNNALFARDGGMYTRRDDMENLGYVLVFLSKGFMHWDTRTYRDLVMNGKKCLSDLQKCVKGIPLRIKNYLTYLRILKWNEEPDYDLLGAILSDKKVDIRKEIRIRREQRQVEKLRRKRRTRAEGKTGPNSSVIVKGKVDDIAVHAEIQTGRLSADKLDEKKAQRSVYDTKEGEDQTIPICETPALAIHHQLPSEMKPNAVMDMADCNYGKEEQPNCLYCSKKEHNPTLVECLQWKRYSSRDYNEMLLYGRPDPFPSVHFEDRESNGKCSEPIQADTEDLVACREDIERDWEDMLIEEIICDQNKLPGRELRIARGPVRMSNPVDPPFLRFEISEGAARHTFEFIPREVGGQQKHPWDDKIYNYMSDGISFDEERADVVLETSSIRDGRHSC